MHQVRKRKRAIDRKAEIVETAITLSAGIGPDRVTTQHLADAVGVTQPAIFRHFATKADIWDAVSKRVVADVESLAHRTDDTVEGLRDYVHGYLDLVRKSPAIPAILLSLELQRENDALHQRFRALHLDRLARLAGLIEGGQVRREVRADLKAHDLAEMILSMLQSLGQTWTLRGQIFDLDAEGDRLIETLGAVLRPD